MNLHCDLDLENNNQFFTENTPAYEAVPSNQIWLQKDQQFSRHSRNSHIDQMSPHCGPELDESKPIFLQDTLAHDVASPYQVWLHKVQQLRGYHPDKHSLEF